MVLPLSYGWSLVVVCRQLSPGLGLHLQPFLNTVLEGGEVWGGVQDNELGREEGL